MRLSFLILLLSVCLVKGQYVTDQYTATTNEVVDGLNQTKPVTPWGLNWWFSEFLVDYISAHGGGGGGLTNGYWFDSTNLPINGIFITNGVYVYHPTNSTLFATTNFVGSSIGASNATSQFFTRQTNDFATPQGASNSITKAATNLVGYTTGSFLTNNQSLVVFKGTNNTATGLKTGDALNVIGAVSAGDAVLSFTVTKGTNDPIGRLVGANQRQIGVYTTNALNGGTGAYFESGIDDANFAYMICQDVTGNNYFSFRSDTGNLLISGGGNFSGSVNVGSLISGSISASGLDVPSVTNSSGALDIAGIKISPGVVTNYGNSVVIGGLSASNATRTGSSSYAPNDYITSSEANNRLLALQASSTPIYDSIYISTTVSAWYQYTNATPASWSQTFGIYTNGVNNFAYRIDETTSRTNLVKGDYTDISYLAFTAGVGLGSATVRSDIGFGTNGSGFTVLLTGNEIPLVSGVTNAYTNSLFLSTNANIPANQFLTKRMTITINTLGLTNGQKVIYFGGTTMPSQLIVPSIAVVGTTYTANNTNAPIGSISGSVVTFPTNFLSPTAGSSMSNVLQAQINNAVTNVNMTNIGAASVSGGIVSVPTNYLSPTAGSALSNALQSQIVLAMTNNGGTYLVTNLNTTAGIGYSFNTPATVGGTNQYLDGGNFSCFFLSVTTVPPLVTCLHITNLPLTYIKEISITATSAINSSFVLDTNAGSGGGHFATGSGVIFQNSTNGGVDKFKGESMPGQLTNILVWPVGFNFGPIQ